LVLLGEGTSNSRDAARALADQNVMLGFCGGGGSPLVSASGYEFTLLSPQDEYRPTEYMQQWTQIFFDDARRLAAARLLMERRVAFTRRAWSKLESARSKGLRPEALEGASTRLIADCAQAPDVMSILAAEGRYAQQMYALCSSTYGLRFKREPGEGADLANQFLDHANYLAYGIAGVALHTLGISFAFPVLHGKTRRGGLVFDIADLIKDGVCLPTCFEAAASSRSEQDLRSAAIQAIFDADALDEMFEAIKEVCASC
jgi:CRISPR-associated protein Cas1